MTKEPCFSIERLGELVDLPEEDPRRRHLGECPRCRALLAAYLEFREPREDFPGEEVADAEARLGEALRRKTGRPVAAGEGASRTPFPERRVRPRPLRRLRPAALIAAGLLLFLVGYQWAGRRNREAGDLVLRGAPAETRAPAAGGIELGMPVLRPDGAVELRWEPWSEADAYRVHLYTTAIDELPPLGDVKEPRLVLRRDELPAGVASGTVLLWRVAAIRQGDEIALSPLGTFALP